MGGVARPLIAALVLTYGAVVLWRRWRSGWRLEPTADQRARPAES
jgi:hypothetical protein